MALEFSMDLRSRVIAAVAAGMSIKEAAEVFSISTRTISRYRRLLRVNGTLDPGSRTRRPESRLIAPIDEKALHDQLCRHPDATLREHVIFWEEATKISVSVPTMLRSIKRLRWSVKKKHS